MHGCAAWGQPTWTAARRACCLLALAGALYRTAKGACLAGYRPARSVCTYLHQPASPFVPHPNPPPPKGGSWSASCGEGPLPLSAGATTPQRRRRRLVRPALCTCGNARGGKPVQGVVRQHQARLITAAPPAPSSRSDRPVPIPAPGVQLTNLSHVEDLADMLARVPGNYAAMREHFNLVSDRCITLDGERRAAACAAWLGRTPQPRVCHAALLPRGWGRGGAWGQSSRECRVRSMKCLSGPPSAAHLHMPPPPTTAATTSPQALPRPSQPRPVRRPRLCTMTPPRWA